MVLPTIIFYHLVNFLSLVAYVNTIYNTYQIYLIVSINKKIDHHTYGMNCIQLDKERRHTFASLLRKSKMNSDFFVGLEIKETPFEWVSDPNPKTNDDCIILLLIMIFV